MNINRDYLIINDVKKSNIKLDNGSMFFYITDKNTQNIFVNLVINISNNDLIQKYANIENAEDYTLTMNIVKPSNTYKVVEGKLHDKENAIFEFNLNEDCYDEIGTYRCELLTKCNIDNHEEITTSNKLTYKVKSSVLNDLDDIVEAPKYPLVIQLFDKLSDINQYEEDRRANELARQLAEEQRQARFNTLDADMVHSMQAMDDKMVDVENRVSAKEQAVNTLIANTKADIDNYKVAKDQEIDEYKATKDTEINNAITNQDNKIDTAISNQNDRIVVVENNVVAQNSKLDVLETKATTHEARITATEAKNTEQDDRLLDIEKVNNRQDIDIKCLYGASQTIDVAEESNSIYLQNSNNGFVAIDEIQGNTLVNCNKEPNKELILNGNINTQGDNTVTITEGVDGGLVDVALEGNTLVNVSKTKDSTSLPLEEELTYLYENTQYTIQFNSDKAITADITLGGTSLLAQSIVAGLNRINITTPATLVDNKLIISGVGANISEVVVTDTNREFGYFEGMKSVGEGGNLVITSSNSDNSQSNTQQLTHEPLRAVGNTKDRYVLIDGKWYIERRCGVRAYQEGDKDNYKTDLINTVYPLEMPVYEEINYNPLEVYSGTTRITTNSAVPTNIIVKNHGYNCLLKPSTTYTISSNLGLNTVTTPSKLTEDCLRFMDTDTSDVTTMKDVLVLEGDWTTKADLIPANFSGIESAFEQEYDEEVGKYKVECKVIGKNKANNLLVGYITGSGTASLSTNNCRTDFIPIQPNTTYIGSVSSTDDTKWVGNKNYSWFDKDKNFIKRDVINNTPCTSPSNAKYLIFHNATSDNTVFDITKVKLQVEQGNTATEYEPYKESNITFYLNEPLRGTDTAKDKVFIQDDKVIVQRNCGSVTLNGSENENYSPWVNANKKPTQSVLILSKSKDIFKNIAIKSDGYNAVSYIVDNFSKGAISKTGFVCQFYNNMHLALPKACLENEDDLSFKQWLQQNPTTVVYQLAEPTYEEVEYNDVKLFIESFKNSTLSYNSNVPVTSKLHYSYSVPLVDTVAQTASISDEQDQLIINLTTQVAVLEMMTM